MSWFYHSTIFDITFKFSLNCVRILVILLIYCIDDEKLKLDDQTPRRKERDQN